MTAKIEKEFSFLAGLHFEGQYLINNYTLTLLMTVDTDEQREQMVAIERANYFLHEYVESSVFVQDTEKKAIENYEKAGMRVLTLPEEPYDQIIGLVLLSKLNAIMEGKLTINKIIFMSKLAANIKFHTPSEETIEFSGKNWWNDASTRTKTVGRKQKIVDFSNEWKEIGLTWEESSEN